VVNLTLQESVHHDFRPALFETLKNAALTNLRYLALDGEYSKQETIYTPTIGHTAAGLIQSLTGLQKLRIGLTNSRRVMRAIAGLPHLQEAQLCSLFPRVMSPYLCMMTNLTTLEVWPVFHGETQTLMLPLSRLRQLRSLAIVEQFGRSPAWSSNSEEDNDEDVVASNLSLLATLSNLESLRLSFKMVFPTLGEELSALLNSLTDQPTIQLTKLDIRDCSIDIESFRQLSSAVMQTATARFPRRFELAISGCLGWEDYYSDDNQREMQTAMLRLKNCKNLIVDWDDAKRKAHLQIAAVHVSAARGIDDLI
jgi:hypothetical protein